MCLQTNVCFSTVAWQIIFGGPNLAEQNLGGPGRNPQKIFEILFPEIAANASSFKN